MKKIADAFGEILLEERNRQNLSQEELAFKTNLDRTYISLLERGLRQPTISTIFEIAKQLNIAPESFVSKVNKRMQLK